MSLHFLMFYDAGVRDEISRLRLQGWFGSNSFGCSKRSCIVGRGSGFERGRCEYDRWVRATAHAADVNVVNNE